jgi:uncharacterized protein
MTNMTTKSKNPFTWVEIYVDDIIRAKKFYENVLQVEMIPMETRSDFIRMFSASCPLRIL